MPLRLSALFFLLLLAGAARAQTRPELERSLYSPASYYNYAEPGDITMLVNVWGTVRNPGLYEVSQGTRLSTLFSVAGGPAISERLRRNSRTITVRLARLQGGRRQVVFRETMEDEIFASEDDPVLEDGDVLTVETIARQRFAWRDAVTIVNAVALVALAVERFSNIQ